MENLEQPKFPGTGNKLLNVTLGMILVFLIVWILTIGKTIILPFMIALFLSFILDPVVKFLIRFKIPLGLSVTLTLLFAFVVLYLLGLLVYANVQLFVGQFPAYQEQILKSIANFTKKFEIWFGTPLNIQVIKEIDWLDTLKDFDLAKGVLSSVGTFVTFFLKMVIVIIFIAYLLTGKRNINTKISNAFPAEQGERVVDLLENVTDQVQKYLGTKAVVSTVTGIISIIIFLIFGLDFAVFWGFIIFLFNFIPNIGSILASLLPVLFSLVQFGSLTVAFWMAISMVVLQLTMGNIIEPRLMGRTLNLSPMFVIMSLIFWGYIWGVAGMILAVPILGTMTIICENIDSLKFLSVFFRGKAKK